MILPLATRGNTGLVTRTPRFQFNLTLGKPLHSLYLYALVSTYFILMRLLKLKSWSSLPSLNTIRSTGSGLLWGMWYLAYHHTFCQSDGLWPVNSHCRSVSCLWSEGQTGRLQVLLLLWSSIFYIILKSFYDSCTCELKINWFFLSVSLPYMIIEHKFIYAPICTNSNFSPILGKFD